MTEVQQRTAEQLFRTLGELKGGAMKFGQALSIFEGALPEEMAAPYREHLTKLQDSAPPMSTAVVHQQLVREFGAGWKRSIVEFDEVPAAAASIGQVHRGRWSRRHRGRDQAAVPRRRAGAAGRPAPDHPAGQDLRRAAARASTSAALAEELRDRVAEELDYALEAEAQARFADALRRRPALRRAPPGGARASASSSPSGCPAARSLAKVIDERHPRGARPLGRALRPLHVRGPGPHRHAARRPAPRELPGRARAPTARRTGSACSTTARSRGCPTGSCRAPSAGSCRSRCSTTTTRCVEHLRTRGSSSPTSGCAPRTSRPTSGRSPSRRATETFRFSRDYMRAQLQRLQDPPSPENQVAFRLNLPPEYLLIHRTLVGGGGRAVPARGRGAVPRDPRGADAGVHRPALRRSRRSLTSARWSSLPSIARRLSRVQLVAEPLDRPRSIASDHVRGGSAPGAAAPQMVARDGSLAHLATVDPRALPGPRSREASTVGGRAPCVRAWCPGRPP